MKRTIRFDYTGDVQILQLPQHIKSIYIEAYGSMGGRTSLAGNGGKASGTYKFKDATEKILYVYIGARNGWNGGGANTYPSGGNGGGASDIRLVKASDDSWYDKSHTSWETDISLRSRIIVAAGGGGMYGTDTYWGYGGYGGGLIGGNGTYNYGDSKGKGGTQIAGGNGYQAGSFGYGGVGDNGGGGGWYGGGSSNGRLAGAGGGSSYIDLLADDRYTQNGVNAGNGYIIVSYDDNTLSYFLEKDGVCYLPIKEYYNKDNNTFNPISFDELIQKYNSLNYLNINELNIGFYIDKEFILPTDIIDFKSYRLCSITKKSINKNRISYIPSEINLQKSTINLKEQIKDINYKNFLDIESNHKENIDYILNYDNEYKNCSGLDIEILKNFSYISFKFNNSNSIMSKIYLKKYDNLNLTEIKKYTYECTSDLLNTYLNFKINLDHLLINRITKQNIKYSTDGLETF